MGRLCGGPDAVFATTAVKLAMEEAELRGLAFKPTVQLQRPEEYGGEEVDIFEEPDTPDEHRLWEITPTIELPPMHAPSIVRSPGGMTEVPAEGYRGPGMIRTPGFHNGQFVYTGSALSQAEPFDVARTWEYLCEPETGFLVLSARAFQAVRRAAPDATGMPVKVLSDEPATP